MKIPTVTIKQAVKKPGLLLALMALSLAAAITAAAAFPVYGKIGEKYAKVGGASGPLGPAVSNEADAPYGGRLQLFKEGTICWHPKIGDAFSIHGAINAKFLQLGRVEFAYPITEELITADRRGRFNHFRALQLKGTPESSIYWTPETGAHAVYGDIRAAWAKNGWERGDLGYPTSDEFVEGGERRMNFERGCIVWSPNGGARIVKAAGDITSKRPTNTFA